MMMAQLLLLAVVCAAIGVGTGTALQRFLTGQLDEQVTDAGWRSAMLYKLGPPSAGSKRSRPLGPGPYFLDAPAQSTDTLGAVLRDGVVREAAVVTDTGAREQLTDKAYEQLAGASYPKPLSLEIDGLGRYRISTLPAPDGVTLVTGLPTADMDRTVLSVLIILAILTTLALVIAAVVGYLITRRQLTPLSTLASTASRIAATELDRRQIDFPGLLPANSSMAARYTEVGNLSVALDRMLQRISEAMAVRQAGEDRVRQFVADASHELRTPLSSIRGYAELTQRHRSTVPEPVAHAMGRIDSEAKRMTRLVEDMLLLARLDAGRPLDAEPVDLSRLLIDAVSDAHVAGTQHHWTLDVPDTPVIAHGDPLRLHQVLANLLANARIHTPPGTTVSTTCTPTDDDEVRITVSDTGPGIPAEHHDQIFDRFVRGDTTRSRTAGSTGLGLSIVKSVIHAHGGTITVNSGAGATFTIVLPTRALSSDEQQRSYST